jgi:transposase
LLAQSRQEWFPDGKVLVFIRDSGSSLSIVSLDLESGGERVLVGVADHADRLHLVRLPGYCPELNPGELLNRDVKTNALGKSRSTNKAELIATVRSHLHRRQEQPRVIQNLFLEKHVRYAA